MWNRSSKDSPLFPNAVAAIKAMILKGMLACEGKVINARLCTVSAQMSCTSKASLKSYFEAGLKWRTACAVPSLQGWISPITFFFAMFYDPQVVSFVFCCTLGTYHVKCSYWGFLQSKNARWMDGRSHIFRKNVTGQVFTLTSGQQNTLIPYVNSNSQSGSWCPIFIDNICSPNGRKKLL